MYIRVLDKDVLDDYPFLKDKVIPVYIKTAIQDDDAETINYFYLVECIGESAVGVIELEEVLYVREGFDHNIGPLDFHQDCMWFSEDEAEEVVPDDNESVLGLLRS